MLKADAITRRFGDFTALDKVTFRLRKGTVTSLLGPNGAGKTTTLRILAGCLAPTEGFVTVDPEGAALPPERARSLIGYLPENNPLYEEMETVEFLRWSASMHGLRGRAAARAADCAIDSCGLSQAAGKPVHALSRGFRQRVGLARTLLHSPSVLLLDEPTAGLDPNQAAQTRRLLSRLSEGRAILLSTHILSEASSVSDDIVILSRGRVAAQGPAARVMLRFSGDSRLLLSVRPGSPDLTRPLSNLHGAVKVLREDSPSETVYILTAAPGADPRAAAARAAAEAGAELLELRRETASLERAFRELTEEPGR